MTEWNVVGQMGSIKKKQHVYLVNIAKNIYALNPETKKFEKVNTIWFNCISTFKPNVNTGDKVIATGTFEPSKNEKFPFAMKIEYIGIINKDKEEQVVDE